MTFKKIIIGVIVIMILGVAYYAISPLFRVIERDDPIPEPRTRESSVRNKQAQGQVLVTSKDDSEMQSTETTPTPQETSGSPVMGTLGHPAQGIVRVIATADGTIIRFENFETINGPDLRVYLSTDLDATEFVDLGKIKGTKGNINYEVPAEVNIEDYAYVLTWCKPFRILFNYAEL